MSVRTVVITALTLVFVTTTAVVGWLLLTGSSGDQDGVTGTKNAIISGVQFNTRPLDMDHVNAVFAADHAIMDELAAVCGETEHWIVLCGE